MVESHKGAKKASLRVRMYIAPRLLANADFQNFHLHDLKQPVPTFPEACRDAGETCNVGPQKFLTDFFFTPESPIAWPAQRVC